MAIDNVYAKTPRTFVPKHEYTLDELDAVVARVEECRTLDFDSADKMQAHEDMKWALLTAAPAMIEEIRELRAWKAQASSLLRSLPDGYEFEPDVQAEIDQLLAPAAVEGK